MPHNISVAFRILEGPNTLVPFPAVVVEFTSPYPSLLPPTKLAILLAEFLPAEVMQRIELPPGDVAFENAASLVANALHDPGGRWGLRMDVQHTEAGSSQIFLEFYDPQTAMHASRIALQIVNAVYSGADASPDIKEEVAVDIRRTEEMMTMRQPDFVTRSLMRVARARNIPVYPVSPTSRVWRYGQGSAGLNFFEASNHRDSAIGGRLVANKFLSNQLVTRLGLPGVNHRIAHNEQQAMQIAQQLGYPLVVKPIDRGKGKGVTADVSTDDELSAAVAKAIPLSRNGGALVERKVPGDDHRLAVFGGKFKWAVRRMPPRVAGDGKHTIAELIERENRSRSDAATGFDYLLKIDTDMLDVLAKQGLTLEDRPPTNRSIRLRSIANTATGGTIADCSESIHPDNREMAETIARSFYMDALGIDFMTTDITKSWRDLTCAVIEVNATPGFSSDGRAEIILADKFPPGVNGRIPSIVLIDVDISIIERVTNAIQAAGKRVGQTDGTVTMLAGRPRCRDADRLPARVMALILDASCEALVIRISSQEIDQHGFPLDRCDLALIAESNSLSVQQRRLTEDCADLVIDGVTSKNIDDGTLSSVVIIAGEKHQRLSE
jgi:cyanophycin synthetase